MTRLFATVQVNLDRQAQKLAMEERMPDARRPTAMELLWLNNRIRVLGFKGGLCDLYVKELWNEGRSHA